MLNLAYNLKFQQLYESNGLRELDIIFCEELKVRDANLYEKFIAQRKTRKFDSEIVINLGIFLEDFIIKLFNIDLTTESSTKDISELELLFDIKRNFIQKEVASSNYDSQEEIEEIIARLCNNGFDFSSDISIAKSISSIRSLNNHNLFIDLIRYCKWRLKNNEDSILFSLPEKLDFENLISLSNNNQALLKSDQHLRNRNGFEINDNGVDEKKSFLEAKYCLYCHKRDKDSCSKGFKNNNQQQIKNPLGAELNGCPLGQKISEMNLLKAAGFKIAPLAVAVIDNPMLAATGHRICNDCMKSCIYQKQAPVNIPLIETEILQSVLKLLYGFEIYSLLTRWNPLNFQQWLPNDINNKKILIAGLGPAGFTAAHYLLNAGVTVVAIDGLKIEPIDPELSGITPEGVRQDFKPIKYIDEIIKNSNNTGFGGVMEYGITVRWDKNYLKIIRLLLERRNNFRMYGSVRFGSNITYDQALKLGFNHIILAIGAGMPNLPNIPNILATGVRTASDFLMSLHLSTPYKDESLANLHIELPIVVIGGGLTAVDAATESLNYYASQTEKLLKRYEIFGEIIFQDLDPEQKKICEKFIEHAKELRSYPNEKSRLLRKWGGATILYRKRIVESPSYRLNHDELEKAMEEGVMFVENAEPISIYTDEYNHCDKILHSLGTTAARTILIANGTKPNTIIAKEDPEHFELEDNNYLKENSYISTLGDIDPNYSGNVVKAMASAKYKYQDIIEKMNKNISLNQFEAHKFFAELDELLLAKVIKTKRLGEKIIEIIVKAPIAATNFQPGQFYRIQNYKNNAQLIEGNLLAMEPLALTGADATKESGIISLIALEMGGSSDFCSYLKTEELISLMGPTGSPTTIPKNENVLLIGGGLGNAVLFSIGKAMRANDCKILYFAGYRKLGDLYKAEEIEKASDITVWCCDDGLLPLNRDTDISFNCNIVDALKRYSMLQDTSIKLDQIDRILVIGSDKMMAAVSYARHTELKGLFKTDHIAIGSINSPMQCMMKQICAQCLQQQIDPKTGAISYVYSCTEQDQELDLVNFNCLKDRLSQNSIPEKITKAIINQLKK